MRFSTNRLEFVVKVVAGLAAAGFMYLTFWREARYQLPDLHRASGRLLADSIRYHKRVHAYLRLALAGQPNEFGLWASMSEQPLAALQGRLHPGQQLVVYYAPEQGIADPSDAYFTLYQIEADGQVVYAWSEKHRERQRAAIWGTGLFGFILVVSLAVPLRNRATT